ncbi:MAG: bacteriochlorophyll 4-vinyl reductase [Paracoccaceae bacterium]|uniref:bacteriochlorophyll 4-vinyl reductase n=1 Tax=Seohaeicola saemankumensis TaxID=481181 RepID=UPI001E3FF214|nr:bacteriochlorophyll 4-vinyl reductase [Seohaeicola saemankumensis]MCD1627137.1 bacteriochlorophyll 4-vinyl reductase [Seohaeicola saemankumensis]
MSEQEKANHGAGLIGPNAVLQLVPLLDRTGGAVWRDMLMTRAGLEVLPDGSDMIPERPVARLHQALRHDRPDLAAQLGGQAGVATGDYILAHRIPAAAQRLLKILPWQLSARLLSTAIARNAWTFAGSGQFLVVSPLIFELRANPLVQGEVADHPLCDWHRGVFTRLFQTLVHPHLTCHEPRCCATGHAACRFEIRHDIA